MQRFFKEKLASNNNQPLTEDEDLPQKQRLPKPRLPPTGKITSPRKRPMREAGPGKGHPKKKMRLIEGQGWVKHSDILEQEKKEKETKDRPASAAGGKGDGGSKKDGSNQSQSQSQPPSSQPSSQQQPGSKLKHSTSAMDLDGPTETNGEANGEVLVNGVNPSPRQGSGKEKAPTGTDGAKVKAKVAINGTNGEGGMISPESVEAS